MAARYSTEAALDVIPDDNFGLSDGKSSVEEAVEQFYAHTGRPVFARSDVEALTREIVDDGMRGDSDHEYSYAEEETHAQNMLYLCYMYFKRNMIVVDLVLCLCMKAVERHMLCFCWHVL